MTKLSVLIATMPSRKDQLYSILGNLTWQQDMLANMEDVEVLVNPAMDCNIGEKRNRLLRSAKGDYIVFADDDDQVSPEYINLILKAIETGPDCVGINGTITTNGRMEQKWFISKEYGGWYTANNCYYRTPNHISPVRRQLALEVGFPEVSFGEDHGYSMRLLPLLKSEVIITEHLYHYDFWKK